ncbi:MAG: sulfite exporter TauE/SafE family protein [Burkholderiales bacterium]
MSDPHALKGENVFEPTTVVVVVGTFLLAGAVKGVIGLGLPTVSLALLTVALDLPSAMALLLLPSFVTNLWQSVVGGNAKAILYRLWPFLVMATVTVWIGVAALTRLNPSLLTALLGVLLVTYSVVNLAGVRLTIPARYEFWAGPLIGSANGVLTGMTGSFVVPGVMFLQAIGLPRDMLIQAMGMLFTVSTVALAAGLQQANFITIQHGILSTMAVLPALAGMVVGQLVRRKLSEQRFRTVFFAAILVLGAYIIFNALKKLG